MVTLEMCDCGRPAKVAEKEEEARNSLLPQGEGWVSSSSRAAWRALARSDGLLAGLRPQPGEEVPAAIDISSGPKPLI